MQFLGDILCLIYTHPTQNTLMETFDLQGRQVQQPTRGIYIQDGRKVVVK